jgi:ferric-dicitrate binding protein FerR (iron transport regulator)
MADFDFKKLVPRYLAGNLSEDEQIQLRQWRESSVENEKLFSQYAEIWTLSEPDEADAPPDMDVGWKSLEERLGEKSAPKRSQILPLQRSAMAGSRTSADNRWMVAAAFFLMILGTGLYLVLSGALTTKSVSTDYAQQLQIQLPDGSSVKLNSDSALEFRRAFDDSVRVIQLRGEAYFQVVHDQRPFVVKTDNARIRVLGTQFNVNSRQSETQVIVKTGKVSLQSSSGPGDSGVVLTADQMSECRGENHPQLPVEVDTDHLLGWLEGNLVFDRTPLRETVVELKRYYGVEIALEDTSLGRDTITGTFRNRSLETVLASICLSMDLTYSTQNGNYIIRSR